jgi:predicted transcriptional regulator YdeE
MKKTTVELPIINLVGIKVRTNNANEMNPESAKIKATMDQYFGGISQEIQNKKNPGVIFSVYTEYESDFTGDYTYFIGEEVLSLDDVDSNLAILQIPIQNYVKFTNGHGKIPDIVIDAWQDIWKMESEKSDDLVGERAYIADFEIYDERCHDLQNAIVDIYVGIK